MKQWRKFLLISISCMVIAMMSCQPETQEAGHRLRVVTTIAPLYSFTKNVAGDLIELENLLPSGAGPHEYSLSPADAKKAADADVLIINGVNLEPWVDTLIRSAEEIMGDRENGLTVIETSRHVAIVDGDPHIWLSPNNAVVQVSAIRDGLIRADPGNRAAYMGNASEYIFELEKLDLEIRGRMLLWESPRIVTFHRAFGYLARDYGLEQAAVIQEQDEVEPSPRHIAAVMDIIKTKKIRAIFSEPQFSHKIVDSIARDLNLSVYSLDTLETGELSREWYIQRMLHNLDQLDKGLVGGVR